MKLFLFLTAFIPQISATTVFCNFWDQTHPQIGFHYTCNAFRVDVTQSQEVLFINGQHNGGRNNSHVTVITARNHRHVNFVLRGLSRFFPNLIGINQDWNSIAVLYGNEFDEYQSLQYLSLDSNYLRHIPGSILSLNGNMRVMFFAWNLINSVGENFLNAVARVNLADFAVNVCINQFAQTPAQVQSLVSTMRNNCSIQEAPTTSTTTVRPPGSCDLHETVCELREQNENLLQQNAEINARLDEMSETLIKMNQLLLELTSRPCGR